MKLTSSAISDYQQTISWSYKFQLITASYLQLSSLSLVTVLVTPPYLVVTIYNDTVKQIIPSVSLSIIPSVIPFYQTQFGYPVPDLPGKHVVQLVAGSVFELQEEHVPLADVVSYTLTTPVLQFLIGHPNPERPGKQVVQLVAGSKLRKQVVQFVAGS